MSRPALQRGLGAAARVPGLSDLLLAAKRANRATYRFPRPVLPDRRELPVMLNRRGLLGCAIEVGVGRGEFSEALLHVWRGRHLLSVDPWSQAPADGYRDIANVSQDEHERLHRETLARLSRYGSRSTVWRMTGTEAAARLPAYCLDFVYLDARHDRASVLADLDQWFDKVRPGGVLAGHDYVDGSFPEGEFGVRSAVDEFLARRHLKVRATFADPPWPSWYVLLSSH